MSSGSGCGPRRGPLPLVLLACCLIAGLVAGPLAAGEVSGRVVDPRGNGLPEVLVTLPELAMSAVSGQDGAFRLEGVPEGSYVLVAEGGGLVPARHPVQVPQAAPLEVTVLQVAAIKEGVLHRGPEDAPREPTPAGEVTAADAGGMKVQLLCTNCNAASLSMLGLTADHMDLSVDGVPIFEGIEAVWALSMLPQEAVAKTVMVPGPGSVFSGPAGLAGRMDLVTRDPFDGPAFHTEVSRGSFDLWSEEVMARGKISENFAADVVATHSTSDAINPNGDTRNEQGSIDRETLTARFHYRFPDESRLRIGLHGYREDQWGAPGTYLDRAEPIWLEETVPIERRAFHARWEKEFAGGAYLRATGLLSDRDQTVLEEDAFGIIFGGDPEMKLTFDIDAAYEYLSVAGGGFVGTRVLLEGGLETSREDMEVFNRFAVVDSDERIHDVVEQTSAYLQATVSLPRRVDLVLGLRRDDFHAFGAAWNPRLGLRWKPLDGLYVNLGLGASYRPPRPVFEEVCCGNRYQSNDEIDSERGKAAHLSLAWYPSQRWKVTLAGMRAELDDHILHLVTGNTAFNAIYRNENVPEATIQGVETGFTFRLERLSLGGSLGFVGTDFRGTVEGPLPGNGFVTVLTDEAADRLPYVSERTGSLFARWGGARWDAALQADYFGSQWIQVLDADQPSTEGPPLLELRPTPSYWSVNLQAGRRWGPARFFAGVDNLLDEYQDDFESPYTSAKWGLQRGRFWYAGVGVDF